MSHGRHFCVFWLVLFLSLVPAYILGIADILLSEEMGYDLFFFFFSHYDFSAERVISVTLNCRVVFTEMFLLLFTLELSGEICRSLTRS